MTSITHRGRWRFLAALLAAGALLTGGAALASASLDNSTDEFERANPTADEAEATIEELLADAPASQRAALSDGNVTLEEYRSATTAAIDCVVAGLEDLLSGSEPLDNRLALSVSASEPMLSADGYAFTYTYSIEGDVSPDIQRQAQNAGIGDRITEVDTLCQEEHSEAIQAAYQLEFISDPQAMERTTSDFVECVTQSTGERPAEGETAFDLAARLADRTTSSAEQAGVGDDLSACYTDFPSIISRPSALFE